MGKGKSESWFSTLGMGAAACGQGKGQSVEVPLEEGEIGQRGIQTGSEKESPTRTSKPAETQGRLRVLRAVDQLVSLPHAGHRVRQRGKDRELGVGMTDPTLHWAG